MNNKEFNKRNNELEINLCEGVTKNDNLQVFPAEINPHSEEHRRYQVVLVKNGEKFLCGEKGLYKSKSAARKIYNRVISEF